MKGYSTLLIPTILLSILSPVFSQNTPTNATSLPLGSCTSAIPCSNGACCNGASGFCGFGSDFCGAGVCTSNCNAQAECGKDAPPANTTCPLKVCCSKFGFCGTTDDFCGDGCQSGCESPSIPSCGTNQQTALTRRIGYYEAWAATRGCMSYTPEKISAETLTHINFAFALISSSFNVVEMSPGDSDLWKRTTALKSRNPTLKVFLSIGGWTFNDPPTAKIFSDMVGSDASTKTFITSLLRVFETYGFDGLDVDWEYPGASDRGGVPADTKNYVTFMAAVKKAFSGPGYGLTFTAPSSFWYLQHFDLPGLLEHADWVNVMTYDLHGTWDGVDIWIGPLVEAHTNLTEIDLAFKLYWRVGIDPSQMVMGLGFYGRSFTLASSDCSSPGCIWASGANAGPCSGQSGILMYNEIMSILSQTDSNGETPSPVFDEDAAVKYVVWDTNQWVSYDDSESFAVKMNYANDHCIGGTMIWSMDQDDDKYTALQGLYPGIAAAGGGDTEKNDKCIVSDCNVKSCGNGWNKMGTTMEDPLSPNSRCVRLICCPESNTPSSCTWRGGDSSPCNPTCNAGEQSISSQACESGGSESFCCTTDIKLTDYCTYYDCTDPSTASCQQSPPQTLFTTVRKGELDLDTIDFCQDVKKNCPPTCKKGQVKPFCCVTGVPFNNCKWYGTPPLCHDNGCPLGQILLTTDVQGDASKSCSGSNTRSYCCDFDGHDIAPILFSDIFPDTANDDGTLSFQEEFDPDEGVKEGSTGSGSSSPLPNDQVEDDTAFGEVFIDSPTTGSVSSVELSTNWVITSCSQTSDQPQAVPMYCSIALSTSECAHVFVGGAEHTIVKLPTNCGRGPYARVASLDLHPNQNVLSTYHQAQKPADEPVFLLKFDYDFSVIPDANGPIYMRADVTDMPDYWDNIVDSPPERKRWLQERGLEERWWGTFKTWVSKMTTVEKDTSVSRNFHWSDTWTIFHKEVSCPGPPSFEASIDVSLTGQASLNTRYGFYLQATVVPPAVQAAYLYFSADAKAHGQFTLKGEATVQYDSSSIQFASFGFPGLYYPGLLTIGPSLTLNGYITGQLSVSGQFTTSVGYTFPTVNFNVGKTDPDQFSSSISPADFTSGIGFTAGYNVELAGECYPATIYDLELIQPCTGDLSIHVVPSIQMGISVLGGAVIDAQAFVAVDLYTGVRINGSVSNAIAPKFCIAAYYGVSVDAGLTGNVLYWETGPLSVNFYANEQEIYGQCFMSGTETVTINDRSLDTRTIELVGGTILEIQPSSFGPAYLEQRNSTHSQMFMPRSSDLLEKRGSVPFLPGFLNCPDVDDHIGADGTDNDPYSDLNLNTLEDAFERRSLDIGLDDALAEDSSNFTLCKPVHKFYSIHKYPPVAGHEILVKVSECPKVSFSALAYNNLGRLYFDLQNPTAVNFDPTFSTHGSPAPGAKSTTYGREHIYEIQLISDFMSSLATQTSLWQPVNTNFCDWLTKEVVNVGLVQNLLHCFPFNSRIITPTSTNPYMPWLEAVANGIKANTIHGNSLASATTWKKYTFTKMLSVMRSTAGLASYMNDPEVRESFISQSNCMKGEWNTWYTSYSATNNVVVTGGITSIYTSFIRGVMSQFSQRLTNGLDDMITFWDNAVAKIDSTKPAPKVALNYGVAVPTTTPTLDVKGLDLSSLQNFIINNGVTWWSRL
ncbi:hypothetical protein C8R44DRAFT_984268 [Mycena epipterygia]|nr:hypothetical protein C8R44DRAFT_984268 [Mycena epipterygia]